MTNSIKRKILTKAALYFWISKGLYRIVIADATNHFLLNDSEIEDMMSLGVEIEQIRYDQNAERTIARGKGYAEGMLIEHALENSAILGNATHFYKSTGKTFVRNFAAIDSIIQNLALDTLIWKHSESGDLSKPWIDARFYFASIDFAVTHLIPSYLESNDRHGACEFHIYQELNKTCLITHSLRPLVCGFAGGTDAEYFDESLGYLDHHYPCWMKK